MFVNYTYLSKLKYKLNNSSRLLDKQINSIKELRLRMSEAQLDDSGLRLAENNLIDCIVYIEKLCKAVAMISESFGESESKIAEAVEDGSIKKKDYFSLKSEIVDNTDFYWRIK